MQPPKTICLTVTNDLHCDQRMIRICGSLADAGYEVLLIGRNWPDAGRPVSRKFRQYRISCLFNKGKLFYIEYNLRLFIWLLFRRMDIVCAVDLDTIIPCYLVSLIRGIPRVYDAHELFPEMKEVVTRPAIRRFWLAVERFAVPRFRRGYTVSRPLADHFKDAYGVEYEVIRNMPVRRPVTQGVSAQRIILYQGAVNEGRCFEWLIPAMRTVDAPLHIYGDGNFMSQVRTLVRTHGLEDKVLLMGKVPPERLPAITETAMIGISLFEDTGRHNRSSLANRFFDFIQAGVPQVCSDFPAYREINDRYRVACMTEACTAEAISDALNNLLGNELMYLELRNNCLRAARELHWQEEEKGLIAFYKNI